VPRAAGCGRRRFVGQFHLTNLLWSEHKLYAYFYTELCSKLQHDATNLAKDRGRSSRARDYREDSTGEAPATVRSNPPMR
jgi:hypothetical protein